MKKHNIEPHPNRQELLIVPAFAIHSLRLDLENIMLFLERSCDLPHVKEAYDIAKEQLAKFHGKIA